jgi:hypothetical protein
MAVCSHFVGKMYSFGVKSGGVCSKRRLLKGFKKRVLIYIAPALPLGKSALCSDDVFVRTTRQTVASVAETALTDWSE